MATRKKKDEEMTETPENGQAIATSGAGADMAAALRAEFEKAGAKQVNVETYFHKFADKDDNINPIAGYLLDRKPRPVKEGEKQGFYYIIGLTHPTRLWTGEGEEVQGKPGMYAWVDERWSTQSLEAHLPVVGKHPENGLPSILAVTRVAILPKEKKKLKGGRTLWVSEVMAHVVSPDAVIQHGINLIAPRGNRPPPALPAGEQGDIPF